MQRSSAGQRATAHATVHTIQPMRSHGRLGRPPDPRRSSDLDRVSSTDGLPAPCPWVLLLFASVGTSHDMFGFELAVCRQGANQSHCWAPG